MIISRAQSGAVSVKFKLKANELFTRYRTDDKSTVTASTLWWKGPDYTDLPLSGPGLRGALSGSLPPLAFS